MVSRFFSALVASVQIMETQFKKIILWFRRKLPFCFHVWIGGNSYVPGEPDDYWVCCEICGLEPNEDTPKITWTGF
jgi:hypothetical protein